MIKTLIRSSAEMLTSTMLALCSFVDGGGNPDAFTRQVFQAALQQNQGAKGKVLAVRCAPWYTPSQEMIIIAGMP